VHVEVSRRPRSLAGCFNSASLSFLSSLLLSSPSFMSSASASAAAASAGDALSAALAAESAMCSAQHPNDARLAARGNVQDADISDVTVALANGVELLSLARITLRYV
jgi:hypothetical protein